MSALKRYPDFLWVQTALLMLAFVPLSLLAYYFETRSFNGINLWTKPIKFQVSATVHLFTLFWVSQLMTEEARRAWIFKILIWASCVATAFEIFTITLRASQGTASHFNFSSQADAILYGLMGIGAVTMLLPAVYLAIRFTFRRHSFKGEYGLHLGVTLGFLFASVLTLLFAGYMSANGSHWTSGQTSDSGGLPLLGWSQTGGDLRPAHFFALHLMQVLPILGFALDRYSTVSVSMKRGGLIAGLFVVGGLSVFTFNQALAGKPFISMGSHFSERSDKKISQSELSFWRSLSALCGKQFEGEMTFPAQGQDSFAGKALVAYFEKCEPNRISVPFAVGEDESRTWVFEKSQSGIQLKHDHRHHGKVDEVSNYGGMSIKSDSNGQLAFPADAYTAQLIPEASTNVWFIKLRDEDRSLTYHLERHNAPRFTAELKRVD